MNCSRLYEIAVWSLKVAFKNFLLSNDLITSGQQGAQIFPPSFIVSNMSSAIACDQILELKEGSCAHWSQSLTDIHHKSSSVYIYGVLQMFRAHGLLMQVINKLDWTK